MRKITKKNLLPKNSFVFLLVTFAFIAMQVMDATGALKSSLRGQLIPICAYIVLAVSLNLVVGISGELSLGHAGFMGVGAFTGVVVATALAPVIHDDTVRLVVAMLIGGIMAGVSGALIVSP